MIKVCGINLTYTFVGIFKNLISFMKNVTFRGKKRKLLFHTENFNKSTTIGPK